MIKFQHSFFEQVAKYPNYIAVDDHGKKQIIKHLIAFQTKLEISY